MSAASAERARVFFALWPDANLADALAQVAVNAAAECGGRATPREKIHLTLFFVGDLERSRIPALQARANAVAAGAFELDLGVLGYWRHNRIVWAGTNECPRELARLVSVLTRNLADEGICGEDRPYAPHVTLVRNARRAPGCTRIESPIWHAREIVLVESVRGRYDIIARWPLARSV